MSSDSESDFWVESPLEQKSIGITVFIPDDEPETLNKSKDEMEELFKQSPNDYYREHVQTLIDRLRAGAWLVRNDRPQPPTVQRPAAR